MLEAVESYVSPRTMWPSRLTMDDGVNIPSVRTAGGSLHDFCGFKLEKRKNIHDDETYLDLRHDWRTPKAAAKQTPHHGRH